MLISAATRVSAPLAAALPAGAARLSAAIAGGADRAMRPVQPAGLAAGTAATENGRQRSGTEGRGATGSPDGIAEAGTAPILALMRHAAIACVRANASGDGDASIARAMSQAPDGLQVRGNLIAGGPDGFRIGSGQIYSEGQLVAAFAGNSLALFGGRVSRMV